MNVEPSPESESAKEEANAPDVARPIKQLLAWAMGDREMEAEALAEETAKKTEVPKEIALHAALRAVALAHGDTGIADKDPSTSDVAHPSDVAAVSRQHRRSNARSTVQEANCPFPSFNNL